MPGALTISDPLRPSLLDEFVGQEEVVRELRVIVASAKTRGEMPDHMLFSGPPGLGKTTLAQIVANELEARFEAVTGPALERPGDLASVLSRMGDRTVLFIDEIHRLPATVEEVLYPAMEDRRLDVVVGQKGPGARVVNIPLRPFTLIGATTQTGSISDPLRDRFGYAPRLRLYTDDEVAKIVLRSARLLGVPITPGGAEVVAGRSRGTPRVANQLLRRVRDWAEEHGVDVVGEEEAEAACSFFRVDKLGLDPLAQEVLEAVCVHFGGGPVGVTAVSQVVGESPQTIEQAVEPHLLRLGLLVRTARGRKATDAAFEHLGLPVPGGR